VLLPEPSYQLVGEAAQNLASGVDGAASVQIQARVWRVPAPTPVFQVDMLDGDGKPIEGATAFLTLPPRMVTELTPRPTQGNPSPEPATFAREGIDVTVTDLPGPMRIYRVVDKGYKALHPNILPSLSFVVYPAPDPAPGQEAPKQQPKGNGVGMYVCFSDGQVLNNKRDQCAYRMDWPTGCENRNCKPWVSSTGPSSVPVATSDILKIRTQRRFNEIFDNQGQDRGDRPAGDQNPAN
jgi:hypothetical protein